MNSKKDLNNRYLQFTLNSDYGIITEFTLATM